MGGIRCSFASWSVTANSTLISGLPGFCRWRSTWKWMRTWHVSPGTMSFPNPENNTRQRAVGWTTRGFNSRASSNRTMVLDWCIGDVPVRVDLCHYSLAVLSQSAPTLRWDRDKGQMAEGKVVPGLD